MGQGQDRAPMRLICSACIQRSMVLGGEKDFGVFWSLFFCCVFFSCFSERVSSRSECFQQAAEEENSKLILLHF